MSAGKKLPKHPLLRSLRYQQMHTYPLQLRYCNYSAPQLPGGIQLDKECMHHQILWNRGQLHKLYTMLRRPMMKCQQHSLCIQMSQPWLKIYLQYRKCTRFFH